MREWGKKEGERVEEWVEERERGTREAVERSHEELVEEKV